MRKLMLNLLAAASFALVAPVPTGATANTRDLRGVVICDETVSKDVIRVFHSGVELYQRIQECLDGGGTVEQVIVF